MLHIFYNIILFLFDMIINNPLFYFKVVHIPIVQASIISCLSLIGGFDSRPRIGGKVCIEDGGRTGVIAGINYHGKITIQYDDGSGKRVPISGGSLFMSLSVSFCLPLPLSLFL